jgi:hypothetical protein
MKPGNLTHLSFLESEDSVAHEILLHQVIVTTDPIEEQNADQHHTEEAAALLWEREHAALNVKDFWYNGTHWQVGGNCSAPMGVCIVTDASTTPVPERIVYVNVTVPVPIMVAASGAPLEALRFPSVIAIIVLALSEY